MNCRKEIKSLELKKKKKQLKKTMNYNIPFTSWIDEKDIAKMSQYFREPKSSQGKVKIELDLFKKLVLIHQSLLKRLI